MQRYSPNACDEAFKMNDPEFAAKRQGGAVKPHGLL
jgi:hypothetical protein